MPFGLVSMNVVSWASRYSWRRIGSSFSILSTKAVIKSRAFCRTTESESSALQSACNSVLTTFIETKPNGEQKTTPFEVLARAVQELTTDLIHRGHSRDFLHDWLPRNVLADNGKPYLENLATGDGLGKTSTGDYSVLFGTFATQKVADTDRIRFVAALSEGWTVPTESPFRSAKYRLAVVRVNHCLDWQAAIEQSREELVRYLGSIPLAVHKFDRTLLDAAAARREPTGPMFIQQNNRRLVERSINGAGHFYSLRQQKCNPQTYAELDRVMYWYEQSRGWDNLGRLIALWTAMEFLFGQLHESAVRGIQISLPAYVVPQYARLLVLDLRTLLNRLSVAVARSLVRRSPGQSNSMRLRSVRRSSTSRRATATDKRLKTMALDQLLAACWEKEATNALMKLVKDYPNLTRKIRRIRRLEHPFKKSTEYPAVWHDIDNFEKGLLNDLSFAYRARNQIVHAAAVKVVQLDRLVQRLNWMLCTTMDVLIHQFANHPSHSLKELHEANLGSYRLWKETLKSEDPPLPLLDILNPTCHGCPPVPIGRP